MSEIVKMLEWLAKRLGRESKVTVQVNGRTFSGDFSGSNVVLRNGVLYVDGKELHTFDTKNITVVVEGNVGSLKADGSVTVNGSVTGDLNAGGSVTCGDVGGRVDAGGSVVGKSIKGGISAGGSVQIKG